jgi:hypothetical protein
MKNKKTNRTFIILFSVIIGIGILGCQKYPDGPLISFKSKAERLSNTWSVDNYKVNGNDYTSLVSGYTETFTKGGSYSYNWGIISGAGTWAFQNNDKEVRITGTSNQSDVTLFILKLESTQFWYYIMDGDDKKEFHMIQK